jgi:hypothetical protein
MERGFFTTNSYHPKQKSLALTTYHLTKRQYFCNRKSEMKKIFCHIAISLVFRINNCIAAPSLWAAIFFKATPANVVRTHSHVTALSAT